MHATNEGLKNFNHLSLDFANKTTKEIYNLIEDIINDRCNFYENGDYDQCIKALRAVLKIHTDKHDYTSAVFTVKCLLAEENIIFASRSFHLSNLNQKLIQRFDWLANNLYSFGQTNQTLCKHETKLDKNYR